MRTRWMLCTCLFGAAAIAVPPASAQTDWVTFENESSSRLVGDPAILANDGMEKDYAWGDFDQDGDVDMVVVRKQPFTNPVGKRNLLLMNEGVVDGQALNGVLVDRTSEFMTDTDDGTAGFMDETNDRDVAAADINGDGWIDVITATAYGGGLPKTMSHSRIYLNLGEDGGEWLGFEYQEARIPQLVEAPATCGVAVGDVTGDGAPDLYFVSYNSTLLEDHLLVNDGNGFFADESNRLTSGMLASGFGSNCIIADMNGDGWADIVKSENGPVKIIYNNGFGGFNQFESASVGAHYHVTLGELNNDGKLDLVISDDGADRYGLNQGPGGNGMADFSFINFAHGAGSFDDGFASNSVTADLNNDGFNDVLIADVDVDLSGCGRRTHIYRNLGNLPNVTLQEQLVNGEVVGIPTSMLTGTHDIAVFDVNSDGWLDLVIGRCSGTQVWVNQPPTGLAFAYPDGLPIFVPPGEPYDILVRLQGIGSAEPEPGSAKMFLAQDGGAFVEIGMTDLGNDEYVATIPAMACTTPLDFYFTASITDGQDFFDPPLAPGIAYSAIAALSVETTLRDDIEEDTSAWQVVSDGQPGDIGAWEPADPVGTLFSGQIAAPSEDATQAHEAVMAFVTDNGVEKIGGLPANLYDIDGGPFRLLSPVVDLEGTDAEISYARWFFSDGGADHVPDFMTVDISNDGGGSWTPVPDHTTGGTGGQWEIVELQVSEYVTPTSQVRLRWTASDLPNNSVTEAGIDNFKVDSFLCTEAPPCAEDVNGDSVVDVSDLVDVVLAWGSDDDAADITDDGIVDVADLVALILAWGDCPSS